MSETSSVKNVEFGAWFPVHGMGTTYAVYQIFTGETKVPFIPKVNSLFAFTGTNDAELPAVQSLLGGDVGKVIDLQRVGDGYIIQLEEVALIPFGTTPEVEERILNELTIKYRWNVQENLSSPENALRLFTDLPEYRYPTHDKATVTQRFIVHWKQDSVICTRTAHSDVSRDFQFEIIPSDHHSWLKNFNSGLKPIHWVNIAQQVLVPYDGIYQIGANIQLPPTYSQDKWERVKEQLKAYGWDLSGPEINFRIGFGR